MVATEPKVESRKCFFPSLALWEALKGRVCGAAVDGWGCEDLGNMVRLGFSIL
jgi:hypothetical protein